MNNIVLIAIETIVCYLMLILLYKKFKTDGVYVFAIIATLMSCILNLKQINIISATVPLGFGVTTSIIIGGNLITQKRGPEELTTYIILVLVTALLSCCFLNLTGLMESSIYNEAANESYNRIFKYNLRIYIGLIISLILCIWLSGKIYHLLKRMQNKIIISNIFTVVIIELLENVIFVLIAYLFEYDAINIILCLIFRYMIKTIVGVFGTIPLYIANKIK